MEEIAAALRTLLRHPLLLALALLVAVAAALFSAYRLPSMQSRSFQVAVASEEMLLDTPTTQVVKVSPTGVDTLGPTATLLADIVTTGSLKQSIAQRAGIKSANLSTTALNGSGIPGQPSPIPASDSFVRRPGFGILTTETLLDAVNQAIPVIRVEARAADAATAERIANAAVTTLAQYVGSTAEAQHVSSPQRLRVVGLGPAQTYEETSGTGLTIAIALAAGIFIAFCMVILLVTGFKRGWRRAAARERYAMDDTEDLLGLRHPAGQPVGHDEGEPVNGTVHDGAAMRDPFAVLTGTEQDL